jgi:hypothetical protein
MRKQSSTLILGLLATLALAQPLQALADSEGGKSGSSSRSESRSSGGESHSSRSESRSSDSSESHSSRGESHSSDSYKGGERSAKNESSDERFGHERGEGRRDWDAGRHQQGIAMGANRPAMTPEAAALFTQARQAAFEYRTTGNADSLAALQSLRASLVSMGFTPVPGGNRARSAPTAPAAPTPAANTTGATATAGSSGVIAQ